MSATTDGTFQRHPPGGGRRFIPIVRAPLHGTLRAISLSLDLLGCWMHWSGEHLLPCRGKEHGCRHCKAGHGKKWLGYLGVWLPEPDRLAIMEIPALAAAECGWLDDGALPDLRGYHVSLGRHKDGPRGRVWVDFTGQVKDLTVLPPPFDVLAYLERVWTGGCVREANEP